jgi:hypothetical protein
MAGGELTGPDSYLQGKPCPKCGYVRTAADMNPTWQCPKCRVAYAKAQAAVAKDEPLFEPVAYRSELLAMAQETQESLYERKHPPSLEDAMHNLPESSSPGPTRRDAQWATLASYLLLSGILLHALLTRSDNYTEWSKIALGILIVEIFLPFFTGAVLAARLYMPGAGSFLVGGLYSIGMMLVIAILLRQAPSQAFAYLVLVGSRIWTIASGGRREITLLMMRYTVAVPSIVAGFLLAGGFTELRALLPVDLRTGELAFPALSPAIAIKTLAWYSTFLAVLEGVLLFKNRNAQSGGSGATRRG